ncbi:TetR/AcrR family transcriptional regulator [Streptoalloteichus hindustanus]|uniref:Transcriptional regulator, TetR family n=1 Tax=Streptoalloteichus hindustanus TaxID=2017 RepID=A0A1M5DPJ1_STRHI|nr:TetR/AcrR family transcriptional regulator C-terminal domain-containing protein [Streptoalloteichus hindustanus]SHF68692.1 transcriptional regulator, TetR family [Streptoalloteichus hindustanus]
MARDEESALIWTRPEPRTRRPKFTREQIASAALAIADAEGFAAVSMRRIASELGAGTMTLYYYVRTKDELVALMDDALMGEVLVPAEEFPTHWYDALTAVATRTWDVLIRHPWALHSLQSAPLGPNNMRHFEQSLAAVADTGLDAADKFALLGIVDDYVHGSVLRACAPTVSGETVEEALRYAENLVATGEFPQIQALFGGDVPREDSRHAYAQAVDVASARDRFLRGLSALLDGVAARMNLSLPPS